MPSQHAGTPVSIRFKPGELARLRDYAARHDLAVQRVIIEAVREKLDRENGEVIMGEITPELVRELHEARFGAGDGRGSSIAVLSRDDSGAYRVEPHVIAENNGRVIVAGQDMVVSWADGQEMTDGDYAQLAGEMNREAAER